MPNTTNAARRQVKFDGTINLGHVLSALAMLVSGALAYANLDKRTDMNTQAIAAAVLANDASERRLMDAIDKVAEQQKDTNRSVQSIQTDVALLRGRASAGDVYPGSKR